MSTELSADLVAAALRAGADAAEAIEAEHQSLSVTVRHGGLEEVEREESRDLSLRVFIGKRHATVSGSDITADGRARLVERAVAMARLAPEDPWSGLVEANALAGGPHPVLDLFDPADPDPETLEALAREAEAAALDMPRIANSDGGSASSSRSAWRLATSNGFFGEHRATGFHVGAAVIAGEGEGMESGYDGLSRRWFADLPAPEKVGREAARRAASRLGARKIASTTAPVIFENRIATSLIGPFLGAISGPSVARGVSFLKDRLGEAVFSSCVTLVDDPHRPRGLGSSPFDDEGAVNCRIALVDKGVLTTWLHNAASARQLGMALTGHASRGSAGPAGVGTSNLTLEPGDRDLAGLMSDAGTGLLVTSMFGPSLNANTGDWSVGCSGFWFENGEIAYPVSEITVAGALPDIYARLVPGSDLESRGSANSPSLLVDSLSIAGK
ncbi:MAG: TldD/PmbA family protein [Phenylobacterium sp.]|uniref:TldD/PmbA family protein n=1 Tax=Phenylobacterium sp. TaxID=1871053 RepID=UPI0025F48BA6|nr:TldD/PmbA family protein [Phenylobacterium sp.]MCA3711378.1 TldD/PmbA family protein [Phenylobacterium sp.]